MAKTSPSVEWYTIQMAQKYNKGSQSEPYPNITESRKLSMPGSAVFTTTTEVTQIFIRLGIQLITGLQLSRDFYFLGWISLATLLTFPRLATLSEDPFVIMIAIEKSPNEIVEVILNYY